MSAEQPPAAGAPPPSRTPLASTPGYLIRRAQQVHTALWADTVPGGLTGPQYAVLSVLDHWPGIDQQRLGTLASLDRSSTADIVDRLASKLWVVRETDAADARRSQLTITEAAALALPSLTSAVIDVQDRLLSPVAAPDRPAFLRSLQLVSGVDDALLTAASSSGILFHLTSAGHLIRRAQQVHTALWSQEFGGALTGPQYASMVVIAASPGIGQTELGERAALDKSTTGGIVRRLEQRGWVVRGTHESDARRRVLDLSAEARAAMSGLARRVQRVQQEVLAPVPEADRAEFVARLAVLAYAGAVPSNAR